MKVGMGEVKPRPNHTDPLILRVLEKSLGSNIHHPLPAREPMPYDQNRILNLLSVE